MFPVICLDNELSGYGGGKKVGLYHNKDNDLKGLSKNEHNG